jgi:hypothetical protein
MTPERYQQLVCHLLWKAGLRELPTLPPSGEPEMEAYAKQIRKMLGWSRSVFRNNP